MSVYRPSSNVGPSSRAVRYAWLLTIAIGIALAIATLTPGDAMPVAPPGGDKLHHALAFAIMVLPLTSVRPASAMWLAPVAAMYGGLIEYVQPFVNRYGDLDDFVADIVGILVCVIVGCGVHCTWRAARKAKAG